jgi:hypothetical protein
MRVFRVNAGAAHAKVIVSMNPHWGEILLRFGAGPRGRGCNWERLRMRGATWTPCCRKSHETPRCAELAEMCLHYQRYDQARGWLARALQIDPNHEGANKVLSDYRQKSKNARTARAP